MPCSGGVSEVQLDAGQQLMQLPQFSGGGVCKLAKQELLQIFEGLAAEVLDQFVCDEHVTYEHAGRVNGQELGG